MFVTIPVGTKQNYTHSQNSQAHLLYIYIYIYIISALELCVGHRYCIAHICTLNSVQSMNTFTALCFMAIWPLFSLTHEQRKLPCRRITKWIFECSAEFNSFISASPFWPKHKDSSLVSVSKFFFLFLFTCPINSLVSDGPCIGLYIVKCIHSIIAGTNTGTFTLWPGRPLVHLTNHQHHHHLLCHIETLKRAGCLLLLSYNDVQVNLSILYCNSIKCN